MALPAVIGPNECVFGPGRLHRYVLRCRWDDLFPLRACMWIGLNPSTADEQRLDPTLTRIKGFSAMWGYNAFIMTNVFGWRDTLPAKMKKSPDPIGKDNDYWLLKCAEECDLIIACWGIHGAFQKRDEHVVNLLRGHNLRCLSLTGAGHPAHPLYHPYLGVDDTLAFPAAA